MRINEQTKLEKDFIERVNKFSARSGMSPASLMREIGNMNSKKFKDFLEGSGSINSRTMGLITEIIDNHEKKKSPKRK
jgi:hypothetical protein